MGLALKSRRFLVFQSSTSLLTCLLRMNSMDLELSILYINNSKVF